MNKIRRLSIEFQHREVTITVEGSTLDVQHCEPDAANTAAVCPSCNSPWISIVPRMAGNASVGPDRIHSLLQESGLHVQVSAAGQVRICKKSFEELKERF
jgi:hypothetical protein